MDSDEPCDRGVPSRILGRLNKSFLSGPKSPSGLELNRAFLDSASYSAMRALLAVVSAFFVAAVNAHFQLQFPLPRGPFVMNSEPTFCGL